MADTLLFVSSPDEFIDDHGNYCLKCLMGQGMPSSMFVCHVGVCLYGDITDNGNGEW